ncbi:MAG: hypothetical protein JETT_1326 [Candidatus Jettenia ecosi]|uniref:Transposase n=1 Tax=Candidatus Jettenia ecosi TaxID=2494326 RepID=A0A533QCJ8_9BACT|nr:MAG: hypothetical protein JETT_1326 [Candidatus Jettenia ecosi]
MARPLRVEYLGAYYHVINRGNAGENIFTKDIEEEVISSRAGLSITLN